MKFRTLPHLRDFSQENDNWWEAKHVATEIVGWIPSNYVAPLQSLHNETWYHGKVCSDFYILLLLI